MDIDSQPLADRTEVDRLLHQLRSTLARLKAEIELLRLDARIPDEGVAETVEQAIEQLTSVESAARASRSGTIILIDDDARLNAALARQLQRFGLTCRCLPDAEAIDTSVAATRIVADLGILRTTSAASLDRVRSLPMVVVSGSSDPLAREEARMYGARAFLIKPVEPAALVQVLNAL